METTDTSVVRDFILRAHQMYEQSRFLGSEALIAAFEPLCYELAGLFRETRDELRAGIGTATLRGEVPYEGEGEFLMEVLFASEDRQRLDAMRFLYEFFDQEEANRRPRRRTFSLVEMKELVKKVDDWLFRRKDLPPTELVVAKNRLASFVLAVAGEGLVAEVVEAEGIMPTANFLGELDATMFRQATPAELGQKLARADSQLADLWKLFADASFDKGDDLVFRLLLKKHEAEETERELWQQLGAKGQEVAGLEEVRGHVLLGLAAQHREEAELIADESQREAEAKRTAAENKLEQIRKLAAEPAKNEAEAAAKELRIAKLRQQRIRALALAQEAAGREAAMQERAETYETKAGQIFDRLEGEKR